ncbi:hypothetical protein [Paenibacillus daejeonensis]|uniref:hypothetical protein n=1 Tax=Paenibacillus daejeonensis TaxID=135193 RepID=UPI00037D5C43|nr:hypothetical protein [Paenibacillus daejeonensis]
MREYTMSPEELAAYNKRTAGPQVKRWERTMTKEDFQKARGLGLTEADICLKFFNNDPNEYRKQLREWGLHKQTKPERKRTDMTEAVTKEQYLDRRLNGEKRSSALKSMGLSGAKGYDYLKQWGIKEIDAEERELELYAASKTRAAPEPSVPVEEAAAASAAQEDKTYMDRVDALKAGNELLREELQQEREAHGRCMQQADDFAASLSERDRVIADLRSKVADRNSRIADLEAEVDRLRVDAVTVDPSHQKLLELQAEYKRLEAKFEDVYLANIDLQKQATGFIQLRLPVIPADGPNVQRAMIYELIETFNKSVEPAVIERGDIMLRMFELLQQMVAFITADMGELLPGQDLTEPAQRFFEYHNARYIEASAGQKAVS